MKFIQRHLAFILFIGLCLFTVYALARAGGGGGHGGGGGGHSSSGYRSPSGDADYSPIYPLLFIAGIGWAIYGIAVSILLFVRTEFTTRILDRVSMHDRLWNPEFLKAHARDAFYKMQVAWQEKNMNKVKKMVTADLYHRYNDQLNEMHARQETNMISDITIHEIKIICCQDFKDDAKDRYVAHIRGNLLDYTIHSQHKAVIKNPEKNTEDFEDAYYFTRSGDKWLLDHINNDPGFWVLIDAKSHTEA